MHSENNTTYICSFGLTQGHRAAKLAYNTAVGSGERKKDALKKGFRAFFGREVKVPSIVVTATHSENLRTIMEAYTQKGIFKRVVTTEGFDPFRKRGEAKDYNHQVVIRTWPYKSMVHSGHAAVSIKSDEDRTMNAGGPDRKSPKHLYFSWWPAYDGTVKARFKKLFGYIRSTSVRKYIMDKEGLLSERTDARLLAGHDELEHARSRFESGFGKEWFTRVEVNPLKKNLPRQKRLNEKDLGWGVMADKVYLPVLGQTTIAGSDKKKINMFGLNESHMRVYVHNLRKKERASEVYYHKKDPRNSCSGKALEVIRAGGADNFVNTKNYHIWSDPNKLHQTAIKLQKRIEELNNKVELFDEKFNEVVGVEDKEFRVQRYQLEDGEEVKIDEEVNWNKLEVIDVIRLLRIIDDKDKPSKVRLLLSKILVQLEEVNERKIDVDTITPHTVELVELMNQLYNRLDSNEEKLDFFIPIYGALQRIKKHYAVDPYNKSGILKPQGQGMQQQLPAQRRGWLSSLWRR